jgi:4-amino-4-deoxychorismate lyase
MLVNGKPGNLISVRDRGLLYGDGVFRTLRATQGKVRHWQLHYDKLLHDCTALGIDCPDAALLSAELDRLLIQHPAGVVKLIVTRGQGIRGYAPSVQATSTHIWDISPLPDYPDDRTTHGIKARMCRLRLTQQPRLAGIKHLNRLENVLAAAESNDADIAEGLLMDADRVMAWSAQQNMPLHVRDAGLREVMDADEVFVVNSVIGLWPIRELEQRRWTDFPVAAQIRQYLDEQDAR